MKEGLESKLNRIRELDAFLAVRLEVLVALAGLSCLVTIGLFLWYAVIRRNEVWDIAFASAVFGCLIGIPIGRFFTPLAIDYIHSVGTRMHSTEPQAR